MVHERRMAMSVQRDSSSAFDQLQSTPASTSLQQLPISSAPHRLFSGGGLVGCSATLGQVLDLQGGKECLRVGFEHFFDFL